MSMISELVERLRKYASLYNMLPCASEIGGTGELLAQAADTIEELSAKLSSAQMERSSQYYHGGWISCEERLPEITLEDRYSGDVLVVCKWWDDDIAYEVGFYDANGSWSCDSEICKVIAWHPLPEPYMEVRNETD